MQISYGPSPAVLSMTLNSSEPTGAVTKCGKAWVQNWILQELDLKDEAWEMLQFDDRQQTDLSEWSSYG